MRVDNEPLAFYIISTLYQYQLGASWEMSPEAVYRCYSYASGVLYLLLAFPLARRLGRSLAQRWIVVGCLVTPGYMQLFFGYVETYALLVPVVALYLLCGLQALRGNWPLWLPALVLGLGVPLHFSLGWPGPSLAVLALLISRNQQSERFDPYARINVRPWHNTFKNLALAGLAPLLSVAVLLRMGIDPLAYWASLEDHNTLPLLDEPGFLKPIGFLVGGTFLTF